MILLNKAKRVHHFRLAVAEKQLCYVLFDFNLCILRAKILCSTFTTIKKTFSNIEEIIEDKEKKNVTIKMVQNNYILNVQPLDGYNGEKINPEIFIYHQRALASRFNQALISFDGVYFKNNVSYRGKALADIRKEKLEQQEKQGKRLKNPSLETELRIYKDEEKLVGIDVAIDFFGEMAENIKTVITFIKQGAFVCKKDNIKVFYNFEDKRPAKIIRNYIDNVVYFQPKGKKMIDITKSDLTEDNFQSLCIGHKKK